MLIRLLGCVDLVATWAASLRFNSKFLIEESISSGVLSDIFSEQWVLMYFLYFNQFVDLPVSAKSAAGCTINLSNLVSFADPSASKWVHRLI